MAWPKICTPIQRSRRLRFLSLAGVVMVTAGVIVAVVLVISNSSSPSDSPANESQSTIAPPFNITYMLVDPLTSSSGELSFSTTDRAQIARNFEANLNLSVRNILEIRNIISTTGMGNSSLSRRKRLVQCDQDVGGMTGPALTFDFNLINSTNLSCQTQACLIEKITEVYQRFRSASALSIDLKDKRAALRLCSLGALPLTAGDPPSGVTTPSRNTTSTRIVTTAGSTSTRTTTTVRPTVPASISSTVQTVVTTSVSTASSNLTTNKTMHDVDVCIRKLPIIQETTAPYGISLTSTLFYQDDHILVVVGASKFETTLDVHTKQRQIVINGVTVYNTCQRTLDVSLPMISNPSSSS